GNPAAAPPAPASLRPPGRQPRSAAPGTAATVPAQQGEATYPAGPAPPPGADLADRDAIRAARAGAGARPQRPADRDVARPDRAPGLPPIARPKTTARPAQSPPPAGRPEICASLPHFRPPGPTGVSQAHILT